VFLRGVYIELVVRKGGTSEIKVSRKIYIKEIYAVCVSLLANIDFIAMNIYYSINLE
jgi:hypothetical protein